MFLNRVMICAFVIVSFDISAMWIQSKEETIYSTLQHLLHTANKDSIIICPIKTNTLHDKKTRRQESEKVLFDKAISGIKAHLESGEELKEKTFWIFDNRVGDYEKNPAHFEGLLCVEKNGEIVKSRVNYESFVAKKSSFVIYNMPYYDYDKGCFDWAYTEDLFDILRDRQEPCLIVIDESVYNSLDSVNKIYNRFYGKKKVLEYDQASQSIKDYRPWSSYKTSLAICCAALFSVGLYFSIPQGLATALDINL